MTNLLDNIGNGFQKRNLLHNLNIVTVYVENEDDVPFWKHIFDQFKIPTTITPSTHERDEKRGLTRGKQNVLRFANQVNKDFVLCVDSDYDYLLDGATKLSREIKENPFVFQTYTYSIENYKCFAEGLHQVVVETTLNDQQVFDFVDFMERYSEVVYELFLYSFYYEKQHLLEAEGYQREYQIKQTQLSEAELKRWQEANSPRELFEIKEDFGKTISIPTQVNIHGADTLELTKLQQVITERLAALPKIEDTVLDSLKRELAKLGLEPRNTYLFVRGHNIYDNVVRMFLNPVFDYLKDQKFQEYNELAKTDEEFVTKREEYKKFVFTVKRDEMTCVERILHTHKNYQSCPLMQKIRNDVERYKTCKT